MRIDEHSTTHKCDLRMDVATITATGQTPANVRNRPSMFSYNIIRDIVGEDSRRRCHQNHVALRTRVELWKHILAARS